MCTCVLVLLLLMTLLAAVMVGWVIGIFIGELTSGG